MGCVVDWNICTCSESNRTNSATVYCTNCWIANRWIVNCDTCSLDRGSFLISVQYQVCEGLVKGVGPGAY